MQSPSPDLLALFFLALTALIALLLRLQFPKETMQVEENAEEETFFRQQRLDPPDMRLPLTGLGDFQDAIQQDGGYLPPEVIDLLHLASAEKASSSDETSLIFGALHLSPRTLPGQAAVRFYWALTALTTLAGLIFLLWWLFTLAS